MKKIYKPLLYLTILSLPLYLLRFRIGPIPTTVFEILIYISFIFGLTGHEIKLRRKTAIYWALLFVLSGFLAVLVDPDHLRAFGLWKAYFFDGLLLFIMVKSLLDVERARVVKVLIWSGLLTSAAAILLFLLGQKTVDGRLYDLDKLSPNYLAMYLVPIFVGCIFTIVENAKVKKSSYLEAIAIAIMLSALYLTKSRGALMAIPVGLLFIGFEFTKSTRAKRNYAFATAATIILILSATFLVFKPQMNDLGRAGASSNIRYYIWQTSIEIAKENPVLGVGLSNYQDYFTNLTRDRVNYPEFIAPQALTAHNLYLQIYVTCGIMGIVTFLILVVYALTRRPKIIYTAMLVAILAYGLVDTPFFRNDLAALFWVVLALNVAKTVKGEKLSF